MTKKNWREYCTEPPLTYPERLAWGRNIADKAARQETAALIAEWDTLDQRDRAACADAWRQRVRAELAAWQERERAATATRDERGRFVANA